MGRKRGEKRELTLREMDVEKEDRWRDGMGGRSTTAARRIVRWDRELRGRRGVILNISES